MHDKGKKLFLVGDNPFHCISHLSQERARNRDDPITHGEHGAALVTTSLENGADGFMFSVSETTLSILRAIREKGASKDLQLHAIVPYAFEYVRLATQLGTPGLIRRFAKQIAVSGNIKAIGTGFKSVLKTDPVALLKTYLIYEISRIKSSAGKQANLDSVFLHEMVTDMALALDLGWLFKSYVDFLFSLGMRPGFNTRNFPYFVKRFVDWGIDLHKVRIAAPFNKIGFQMNPSRRECEEALEEMPVASTIAISILAAGYFRPLEAIDYIATLPNISGVAVGVSRQTHARETFKLLKERFER